MSDTDGSPRRDDRHHRWSRSRSPVSPGYAGETLAERKEQRLAEAAVTDGPPAGQPWAASADTGPSTQGPAPAQETNPAAQTASPAAPPREGTPGAQGAETAAPASRAAAPTAAPGALPAQGVALAQALAPRRGLPRPERGAGRVHKELRPQPRVPRHRPSWPRRGPWHAAGAGDGPGAGPGGLAGSCRSRSEWQGGRKVPHPHEPKPHPHQPPQGRPPHGADAARVPPGA